MKNKHSRDTKRINKGFFSLSEIVHGAHYDPEKVMMFWLTGWGIMKKADV